MTPPENDRPDDEDGGTFKLKPGAGAQPPAAPQGGEEEGLDRTMKIQRQPGTPPPPPSPLGNPTGPSEPASAPYAETTVMPQSGPQTGYQPPSAPQQPPGAMGSGQMPQTPGQQPYGQQPGQQPGAYPPPPQQGGYPQTGPATGDAPDGVKRIGLMAMIGAGVGLVSAIFNFLSPATAFAGVIGILIAGALGWYGWALPKGKVTSGGLRLTGVILMMIGAGFSLIGVFGSMAAFAIIGPLAAPSLILGLATLGIYGYASLIYIRDGAVKAYIKGAPAGPAYPPQGQPGYPQQGGYPPQPQQPYGQQPPAQPGQQPGGYPPPGHPQQGQQPPYGG